MREATVNVGRRNVARPTNAAARGSRDGNRSTDGPMRMPHVLAGIHGFDRANGAWAAPPPGVVHKLAVFFDMEVVPRAKLRADADAGAPKALKKLHVGGRGGSFALAEELKARAAAPVTRAFAKMTTRGAQGAEK